MRASRVLVSISPTGNPKPYLDALKAADLDPVPCQPGPQPPFDGMHGLVLTGGKDIAPRFYHRQPEPALGDVDESRDEFELELLLRAEAAGLPTLCICRGLQLLNVHRGGTLIQHLPQAARHRRKETPASQAVHPVRIETPSKLAEIFEVRELQVNSRHHQAIDQLGRGLVITARDPEDQVIEAIEDPSHPFLIAVQWHPEDQALADPLQRRLFDALRMRR
jgi:putative glutamine amidotransferase